MTVEYGRLNARQVSQVFSSSEWSYGARSVAGLGRPAPDGRRRVAIAVGKSLGGAARRNRVRRRLREAFRSVARSVDAGPAMHIVLVARKPAGSVEFCELVGEVAMVLAHLSSCKDN